MSNNNDKFYLYLVLWVIAGLLAVIVLVPVGLLVLSSKGGQDVVTGFRIMFPQTVGVAILVALGCVLVAVLNHRSRLRAQRRFMERQGDSSNHSDKSS